MRKRNVLLYSIMSVLCLTLLGGCGSSSSDSSSGEKESYWETQEFDTSFKGSDFVVVGEDGQMQLLLSPDTGTLRWLDTKTGAYQDSNMGMNEGITNPSARQRSDLIVNYFAGTVKQDKLYDVISSYDTYTMCVEEEQLNYQKIDNGIRIVYVLGDDSITYKNFPEYISDERMQEFVLQYLTDREISSLKQSFYTQMSDGRWFRKFGENSTLGAMAAAQIYGFFYETGTYTDEELIADLETNEAEPDEYPGNLHIYVGVDYYLENGSLVVKLDASKLETEEDHPINKIELLPYFMTSATEQDAEEGYMFVPDGSGALIYLDSTKSREYRYSAPYFGGDKLVGATTYTQAREMMLPVFGMKTSNSTIFGVIEDGAEVATLDAYVSGQDGTENFCKMKLTFDIQTQQHLETGASSGSSGGFELYRASNDIYDDNIVVRYYWLGEDADYVDMANCYADYLVSKGLASEVSEQDAPFYVELMGSTDKTQFFLGIPYDGKEALTTFAQAEEILRDLTEGGINNIKLIYSGMVNGGMNQRSLAGGVKLASGLGGSSAFKHLKNYADSIGAQIFPRLQLQTAYTKKNLNNDAVAMDLLNQKAQIYSFDPVKREAEDEADFPLYIISPHYLDKYLTKVKSSYNSKIGLNTMASDDLYSFIPTNYKGKQVSSSTGEGMLGEATAKLTEGLTLMLSNPISDAYAYSNYLTDIPTEDNGMRIVDASVPFIEMVLDGYKTYSSESLNLESTDVYVNFMRVMEGNGVPKFTFIYADSSSLSQTEQEDNFAVDYSYWKDKIGTYYAEYKAFYQAVEGAKIVEHELYQRNENLRVVTYSNGVKVYFNYSDLDETIDGVTVPAFSYIIQ